MLFFGVFDYSGSALLFGEAEQLRNAVSRKHDDVVEITERHGFAVASVHDKAFGDSVARHVDDQQVGMVLGRAYLHAEAAQDANAVLRSLFDDDHLSLAKTRGSFCCWVLDLRKGVIKFCTDKVGVFPIYIARVGQRIYFSTALRMLKAVRGVCNGLDAEELFTAAAFGYPLGTRTVFPNVERMYGGEIVVQTVRTSSANRYRYWSWDKVAPVERDPKHLEKLIFEAFLEAIRVRVENAPGDLSFLSGGLDSRCIVGGLVAMRRKVWSLNFAPEGSQDYLFGKLVAEAIGAVHHELGLNRGTFPERQRAILDSWAEAHPDDVLRGANPYRVWSGDGGSVGLGHVYLDAEFVRLLRAGQLEAACDYFTDAGKKVVPAGMLRNSFKAVAREAPRKRMSEELRSFTCADPAKAGFLFLLMNDQRHHLADYFENVDLCRFELVLPFFDAELLALVVSAPLDPFLGHNFYNRWLHHFPPGVAHVPWQAYPGHEPCPVPTDQYGPLRYQWKEDWFDAAESQKRFESAMAGWRRMLDKDILPDNLVNKRLLRLALWLTGMKVRDYRYVLNTAQQMSAHISS